MRQSPSLLRRLCVALALVTSSLALLQQIFAADYTPRDAVELKGEELIHWHEGTFQRVPTGCVPNGIAIDPSAQLGLVVPQAERCQLLSLPNSGRWCPFFKGG